MAKGVRTQAMRALDAKKVAYTVHTFDDSIRDAQQVAQTLGLPPEQVFKTLVLLREDDLQGRPFLLMVPANCEVDLRLVARELDIKGVRMASHMQAEKLTGLKVGGISALALLQKPFPVYLDRSAQAFAEILVSGGQRGVDLQLRVADLLQVTGAQWLHATQSPE
ncbi:Cys-tRNA(Pro)/Cys-tRNA(Cys) deacylase [Ktedonobacter sp. SOSP1-52]|uniref:aminoacyl-tRNA deacylase n=1 Tax=Ktedonobacter sp. SOSP1-52 TaxID=2778366 RepID=UPI001914EE4D|nr:aminoacyl-tRNA deacylase [Ktedonobacter sp. SOSP1-52]GHO67207.1 Cys-tRNA(Pro)/Cys-tRNA(Cys) deacylase [Ktedonobacter sp. SOSP1-52]